MGFFCCYSIAIHLNVSLFVLIWMVCALFFVTLFVSFFLSGSGPFWVIDIVVPSLFVFVFFIFPLCFLGFL